MGSIWIAVLIIFWQVMKLEYAEALFQGIKKPSKVIQPVTGLDGRTIKLNCYDPYENGVKEPSVLWFFKNCGAGTNVSCETSVKGEGKDKVLCGYNQIKCNPILRIKNLDASKSGIYSCFKSKRIDKFTVRGERLKSYILNVVDVPYKHPKFLDDGPFNRSVNVDDPAELSCTVSSDLPVKFYWLKLLQVMDYDKKDDKFDNYIFEALNATSITRHSKNVYTSTLKFPYVSIHDAGTYGCAASNDIDTIYRQATLEVKKCTTGFCALPNYEQVTMSIYLILLITFCIFLNVFLLCLLKKFLNRVESKL